MIATALEEIRNKWNDIAAGYDKFVTSTHLFLSEEALQLAGLRAGMRFLDIAAGSGALSIPAARLGADVLSVDISANMLQRLEHRAQNENLRIQTRVMDGHALELQDNLFDVVGSQFGVMLFPDMPRGVSEMARVTKPGGRVLLIVFGDPRKVEFFEFFVRAIQAVVPGFNGPSMDPPPLPFQLQDPERVRQEFKKPGLKDVRVEARTEKLEFQSGKQMWDWLRNSNPIVKDILGELNLSKEQIVTVQESLQQMIQERAGKDELAVLSSPINIGIGTKD
jgi:ubiquinone/menaquinone biosynthesis C-methylase UbiE